MNSNSPSRSLHNNDETLVLSPTLNSSNKALFNSPTSTHYINNTNNMHRPSYSNLGKIKISNHSPIISYDSISPSKLKNPSPVSRYSPIPQSTNTISASTHPQKPINILKRNEEISILNSPTLSLHGEKSSSKLVINTSLNNSNDSIENTNPNIYKGSNISRGKLKSPKSTPSLSSPLSSFNSSSNTTSITSLMTKKNLNNSSSISQQQLLPSSLLFKNRKRSNSNFKMSNNNIINTKIITNYSSSIPTPKSSASTPTPLNNKT
jgi:hypothetical protein